MARKGPAAIQETLETNEEFEAFLEANSQHLIMMEVYSDFCGACLATANAVRKCKLELGGDEIAMGKACSDKIDVLQRFRNKSEPAFLFIKNCKLARVMFGANGIEMVRHVEELLEVVRREQETNQIIEPEYPLWEVTPDEIEKYEADERAEKEHAEAVERLRTLAVSARKRRVCSRLAVQVRRLNWILYWPHNHQAHYDLYENWDNINVTVGAKELVQMTEEMAREALWQSDVDLNEACLHALISGPALVVMLKMFETDNRDFVALLRKTLYEDLPVPKEDQPPEKQLPPIPAYDRYASISKTAREVRRARHEAKLKKLREEEEERQRIKSEQERLAREAQEEKEMEEARKKEEERMARIAAGLPPDPEPEEVPEGPPGEGEEAPAGEAAEGEGAPEGEAPADGEGGEKKEGEEGEKKEAQGDEKKEGEEGEKKEGDIEGQAAEGGEAVTEEEPPPPEEAQFDSDVEIEGEEYIPPGGLFVPGLYAPINDLAKANGLKLFFPKEVQNYTNTDKLETELLPPHMLIMFPVDKRHELKEVLDQYKDEVLYMGFFVGDDINSMTHIAYTIKQYDKMFRARKHLDRFAIAVSRKRSLPLLQMAGFNPTYISSDLETGEKECLTLFPVGYGDDYIEQDSLQEDASTIKAVKSKIKSEKSVGFGKGKESHMSVIKQASKHEPKEEKQEEGKQAEQEGVKEDVNAEEVPEGAKEAKAEETNVEEPKVEEPKVEETNVEEPKAEEPKVEEPKVEEPKVEEPKAEESKVEEAKVEQPKEEDTGIKERRRIRRFKKF